MLTNYSNYSVMLIASQTLSNLLLLNIINIINIVNIVKHELKSSFVILNEKAIHPQLIARYHQLHHQGLVNKTMYCSSSC